MTDAPELLPDEIWLLENIEHDEDDDRRIIWSPDSDCERIHEGYKIIGHYTRAARPRPDLEAYKSGTWFHAKTVDDMQAFYRTRLPAIREAARECGYAIAVHGSERRDFDLIAFPWVENPKSRFDLVKSIQFAACGFTQNSYDWALRAHGRLATAFPICWCEWHDMVSAGHIDLSVIDVDFLSTAPRPCVDLEADRRRKADYKIGAWLSAALSDPNVCKEMKSDIEAWFDSRDTAGHLAPRPACPHKRIDHNGECLDCDEPVWADQTMTPIDKAIAALEAAGKAIYGMDNEAHQARHKISEALTELKAARQSGVPDGWVLVPREPTEAMKDAISVSNKSLRFSALAIYKAMIATAPPTDGGS